ncbi:MAG TPA: aminoglycoside phosphotransferase family protein [Acidimicrobiales bacterium]|nr:aminoglycoside phosphotransferase family protein [Acidimicrobiales bacterium]
MSSGWERVRSMPFPELSEEQLAAICERHGFPHGPFGRLPATGVVNAIYTVGDGVVLRIPKDAPGTLADTFTESVAVPAAMRAGVRTPALLAFDESCEIVGVPHGAYEWVHAPDGWPSTDEGWRELGRQLATLHAGVVSCPDPRGRLDAPGRWCHADQMVEGLPDIDDADVRRRLALDFGALESAVQDWAANGTPSFLHDDIKDSNLLQGEGDDVTIIDWGDAGWGDAAIDFRSIPPERTPLVIAGYREVTTTDDTFEERIRWDQLGAVARRWVEPAFRRRLRTMLAGD